jgi:L-aspartate oxidase
MANEKPILIIGAGLAGLFLALKLAPKKCVVLSPAPVGNAASSAWAQGGIAAALSKSDSPELHAKDTINAGAGLVDETVAALVAHEGPSRVYDLLEYGVPFDKKENGELALSLEAAHSLPRVARVSGDLAGREIMKSLIALVTQAEHIEIIENHTALSLLQNANGRICGAIVEGEAGAFPIESSQTILASGGVGGLYAVTTNPIQSRGQGVGMAARCGAMIADPEFVQFHPTAINIGKDPAPLASEALRGEGADLVDRFGVPFMKKYHELGNLAPRDIVARAVFSENHSGKRAFLDATKAVGDEFPHHFPTVFASCMDANIDPRVQPIPVTPAVHYHMGGIVADMWGKTTLDGLSAIGECSSTGLHGANRLASNSLLEAIVFAGRCAERIKNQDYIQDDFDCKKIIPEIMDKTNQKAFRMLMSADLGVVRNKNDMTRLEHLLGDYADTFDTCVPNELITMQLMVKAAIARKESRGSHFRSDFTQLDANARHSYLLVEDNGNIKIL